MTQRDRVMDFETKLNQLRQLFRARGFAGIWISSVVNFAWLTGGGRAFVSIASESSVGKILVTEHDVHLVTTNNEMDRLLTEELQDLGIKSIVRPWYVAFDAHILVENEIEGPFVSDQDLADEISTLRSQLTTREAGLIRQLGKMSAEIVESCCWAITSGERECEIAGRLSNGFWRAGIEPLVLNVAADERVFQFRHPIPTDKKLREHLAISICARKWGLHVTLTRLIHFGSLPDDLKRKHSAAVQIESTAIAESRPGANVKDIFGHMLNTYQETGFSDEWRKHPIGGLIGYQPREYDVTPDTSKILSENQAFCWNPTIAGTKSEDSLLIGPDGAELITAANQFPMLEVMINQKKYLRPDILVKY